MPTDEEIQRQKIEAELATALANQKAAEAAQKAAEAAQREAEAKAVTAEAAADKAKNDAAGDPEVDPEVVEARKRARLAALGKEQAASDAAVRQSAVPALPTIATIAPEVDKSPKVEADGGTGIANLVASTALDITGQEIGRALLAALSAAQITTATIWIVDHLDIAKRDVDRLAMSVRLEAFTSAFSPDEAVATPEAAAENPPDELESFSIPLPSAELASFAVGAGTSLAKFGVELVGALRSRYALYGRKVELDRTALVTSTLRALRNTPGSGVTVRWPMASTISDAPLVVAFSAACNARDAFAARYLLPDVPADDAQAKERHDRAKALVDSFDAYATTITTVADQADASPLVVAALQEASLPRDGAPSVYCLHLEITGQGADAIMGYGLSHGTTASFVGFVQAYYLLTDADGTVVTAGTVINRKFGTLNIKDAKIDFDREK